jgi:hypothetical protein
MIRRTQSGYEFRHRGRWHPLREPHAPASRAQLVVLHRDGLLRLADEPGLPLSKLEASRAIAARATDEEPAA